MADTYFPTWAVPAVSPRTTPRSHKDRVEEVFNVKDFGATGSGSSDDAPGIRAALAAMFASTSGGVVFFPPGRYLAYSQIDVGGYNLPGAMRGSIRGAGKNCSRVIGTVNNGFIFNQSMNNNSSGQNWIGVDGFSDLSIENYSQIIGTGALRFVRSFGFTRNLLLLGMTGLDASWNSFNQIIENVQHQPPIDNAYGSVGICSSGGTISCARVYLADVGIMICGANHNIISIQSENTCTTFMIGAQQGMCSKASISGSVLTLASDSEIHPRCFESADGIMFTDGSQILFTGQNTVTNPNITCYLIGAESTRGQPGSTYSLSGAAGITIIDQVVANRKTIPARNFSIDTVQTEAQDCAFDIVHGTTGKISNCVLTGTRPQGPSTTFYPPNIGPRLKTGASSYSSQYAIRIRAGSQIVFENVLSTVQCSRAQLMLDPWSNTGGVKLVNCYFAPSPTITTDANAFVDNGAGVTAVTTTTAAGTLTFSSVPASVIVGTPLYNLSDSNPVGAPTIGVGNYVQSKTGTTVTTAIPTNAVPSGSIIRFCVPSGVAGNVLTIHGVSDTLGVGGTLQGSGVPTGDTAPLLFDLIPFGYFSGFIDHVQYSLKLANNITSAGSLNTGRQAFTIKMAVAVGADAQTTLKQMSPPLGTNQSTGKPINKAGFDGLIDLGMIFLELPGNQNPAAAPPAPNADVGTALEGMQYDIVDGQKFGGGTALFGDQVEGTTTMPFTGPGAGQHIRVRFDGTVWRRCG